MMIRVLADGNDIANVKGLLRPTVSTVPSPTSPTSPTRLLKPRLLIVEAQSHIGAGEKKEVSPKLIIV